MSAAESASKANDSGVSKQASELASRPANGLVGSLRPDYILIYTTVHRKVRSTPSFSMNHFLFAFSPLVDLRTLGRNCVKMMHSTLRRKPLSHELLERLSAERANE